MNYVKTDDNPVELPSRGFSARDLKESKPWCCGTEFLQYVEDSWPRSRVIETTFTTDELTKKKSDKKRWVTESTYQADISLQNYDSKLAWVHLLINNYYTGK